MTTAGYAWVVMDEAGAQETPVAVAETREVAERYARAHRLERWGDVTEWAFPAVPPANADDPRCMTGMVVYPVPWVKAARRNLPSSRMVFSSQIFDPLDIPDDDDEEPAE